MAKLVQTNLLVSVSKLARNNEEVSTLLDDVKIAQLEAILVELVGEDVLVEIDEVEE